MAISLEVTRICRTDAEYPGSLKAYLGDNTPEQIFSVGDLGILHQKMFALFCSIKCPGNLILKTYDLARELRDAGITVISGFHSPMEKECFSILLRGKQPFIWCLARRLTVKRLQKEYSKPLSDGRLLMLSPFGEKVRRATKETAHFRNMFVAAMADTVFVVYAAPGGKTEAFCRKVQTRNKPLFMFESPDNSAPLVLGARPYTGIFSIVKEE